MKACKYKCMSSSDRSAYNSSDAILVHMRDISGREALPNHRSSHQVWILVSKEAPVHEKSASLFRGLFNATFTYRQTSDISLDYGHYELGRPESYNETRENRTSLVSWLVSNCNTQSNRHGYVKQLQKHIPVDIYGGCGHLKCPGTRAHSDTQCLNFLKKYKFYLSFENSLCEDYITEKVWKVLSVIGSVPVVLGHSNYSALLPPGSYIDVRDFKSPAELAQYLLYLHRNDSEYNKYFAWKETYYVPVKVQHDAHRWCELCEYLHVNKGRHKTVDIAWDSKQECISSSVFYKGVADMLT